MTTRKNNRGTMKMAYTRPKDMRELFDMDLRQRMMVISDITHEVIRYGKENVFLATVISPIDCQSLFVELEDDVHKILMQQAATKLAAEMTAECIITASEAWIVPSDPNDSYSHLRPSLHLRREECLVVAGKDHFEHLVGMQHMRRSDNEISFEELEISSNGYSWLEDWQPSFASAASC